ncbi:MAG: hypothetical protein ABUT20_52955 [Bacteroidota bacterium]
MESYSKKTEITELPQPPKIEWKYLIYAIIIFSQIATWGLILYDKNKTQTTFQAQKKQITYLDSARQEVQKLYDASLIMIDERTSDNNKLDSMLKTKDNEIYQLKEKVSVLLKKDNITRSELDSARSMIKQMNARVFNYLVENEELKKTNQKLVAEKGGVVSENRNIKTELTTVKQSVSELNKSNQELNKSNTELSSSNKELNKKVELASLLTTSNIRLTPIIIKSTGKEVPTTKASKATIIRVSFDINENFVATSGQKVLFVCMYGPDEKPIMLDENDIGTFRTAEGDSKVYSSKLIVNYIQGRKHSLKIDWKQEEKYQPGNYKIDIYYSGYLAGHGEVQFKK